MIAVVCFRLEFELSPLVLLLQKIAEEGAPSMYYGKNVFSQLMEFPPRWMFWQRTAAV
jgi:hypothetical protein